MKLLIAIVTLFGVLVSSAEARTSHHHRRAHARSVPLASSLVSMPTAAGITIRVNPEFGNRIVGFIGELVSLGYRPRHIGCYASGGHVSRSRHYAGAACDFDQRGWGKTAGMMHRVGAIAARYGLRDGCSFRDCGHIDDGGQGRARQTTRLASQGNFWGYRQ